MQFPLPTRLQFSLRTLFVLVAIAAVICFYVAREAKVARDRKSLRAEMQQNRCSFRTAHDERVLGSYVSGRSGTEALPTVPWLRRLFGDEAIVSIIVTYPMRQRIEEIERAFP